MGSFPSSVIGNAWAAFISDQQTRINLLSSNLDCCSLWIKSLHRLPRLHGNRSPLWFLWANDQQVHRLSSSYIFKVQLIHNYRLPTLQLPYLSIWPHPLLRLGNWKSFLTPTTLCPTTNFEHISWICFPWYYPIPTLNNIVTKLDIILNYKSITVVIENPDQSGLLHSLRLPLASSFPLLSPFCYL